MKYGTAFGFRLLVGSLVGVLALAPLGAARAQTLDDGMDKLGKEYDKHKAVLTGLHKGDPAFDGSKAHKDAVDVAAKYYTYRFYLGHYEQPDPSQKYAYEHYRILYDDFDKEVKNLLDPRARGKVEALIPEFSRQVGVHALEVLKYSGEKVAPIVKVNVVRVLARLADLGQPDLVDTLVEVLQDNGLNDGARYYAFRGLHNLLAVPAAPQAAPRLNKEREAKVAGAVVDFLNQKAPVDGRSPREEVDGYRLLRREAVRALAGLHNPTAGKARPALVLAKFAGNDDQINPRPRLDERLEAAIGLAGMRPDAEKLYQPEYAAYQIGQFVSSFGAAAAGELSSGVTGSAKRRPWKVDAVRLADALDGMKAAYPTNKYVGDMVAKAMPVLAKVERWDRNNLPDTSSLRQWLSSSEPPAAELFKGDKDSVVKTGSEEEPEKPAEKPADKPAKPGDKPKGKPTDKPKGKPTGKPGDKPAGKPKK